MEKQGLSGLSKESVLERSCGDQSWGNQHADEWWALSPFALHSSLLILAGCESPWLLCLSEGNYQWAMAGIWKKNKKDRALVPEATITFCKVNITLSYPISSKQAIHNRWIINIAWMWDVMLRSCGSAVCSLLNKNWPNAN